MINESIITFNNGQTTTMTYSAYNFTINLIRADMYESFDTMYFGSFKHHMCSHDIVPAHKHTHVKIMSITQCGTWCSHYLVNSNESPNELSTCVWAARWKMISICFSLRTNAIKSGDVMSPFCVITISYFIIIMHATLPPIDEHTLMKV